MYLEHFRLKSQPFSEHTAVTALWEDQRMNEGLGRLEYLIQCGQLGLITGQSGVGKSALLKRFLHGLLPQHCQALYCHLTHLPSAGLLKLVVTQLGETPRRGKERIYEQILERATQAESTLLLVFDEAHLLDGDALTDPDTHRGQARRKRRGALLDDDAGAAPDRDEGKCEKGA